MVVRTQDCRGLLKYLIHIFVGFGDSGCIGLVSHCPHPNHPHPEGTTSALDRGSSSQINASASSIGARFLACVYVGNEVYSVFPFIADKAKNHGINSITRCSLLWLAALKAILTGITYDL